MNSKTIFDKEYYRRTAIIHQNTARDLYIMYGYRNAPMASLYYSYAQFNLTILLKLQGTK